MKIIFLSLLACLVIFTHVTAYAVETISIYGDGGNTTKTAAKKRPAQPQTTTQPAVSSQDVLLEKIQEIALSQQEILQQLSAMKEELYAIKIRASRC